MRYELGQVSVAGTTVPGREKSGPGNIPPQMSLVDYGLTKNQRVYVGAKRSPRTVRGTKGYRILMNEDYRITDYHPNDVHT